jgi:predicted metal-binding membrane protein
VSGTAEVLRRNIHLSRSLFRVIRVASAVRRRLPVFPDFAGLTLIAAGLYQWTPLKDACLRQCQFSLQFIQRHGGFRDDAIGSLKLGARHGAYCLGCCWMLMTLLFIGGVMNIFWIALISIFVLTEKVVPVGRLISRLAGTLFLAIGSLAAIIVLALATGNDVARGVRFGVIRVVLTVGCLLPV